MVYAENDKYHLDPQEDQLKAGVLPTAPEFGVEDEEIYGFPSSVMISS